MEDLANLRERIDEIDAQIFSLFTERMLVSDEIAAAKRAEGRGILDPTREQEKIAAAGSSVPEEMRGDAEELMQFLMKASRKRQSASVES